MSLAAFSVRTLQPHRQDDERDPRRRRDLASQYVPVYSTLTLVDELRRGGEFIGQKESRALDRSTD